MFFFLVEGAACSTVHVVDFVLFDLVCFTKAVSQSVSELHVHHVRACNVDVCLIPTCLYPPAMVTCVSP